MSLPKTKRSDLMVMPVVSAENMNRVLRFRVLQMRRDRIHSHLACLRSMRDAKKFIKRFK